jgi:hypothetical protein
VSGREEAREMLRELLAEALGGGNGNGDGGDRGGRTGGAAAPGGAPPAVPAPPVAAVLRPSTWSQPPVPGEVIGEVWPAGAAGAGGDPGRAEVKVAGEPAAPAGGARVEAVSLRSDADLARFADAVLANAAAIRSGALRFTLGAGTSPSGVRRIEKGAVTERTVNEAASAGQRLVLAPAAVLTPLARERARHLKVEIERERRC